MSELIPINTIYINSGNPNGNGNASLPPGIYGDSTTSFTVTLPGTPIMPVPGKKLKAAVTTATIPMTFQGVSSTNNTLYMTVDGTPVTVTLTPGNYTSLSFMSMVNAVMAAAVLAQATITMVFTSTLSTDSGQIQFSTSTAGHTVILYSGPGSPGSNTTAQVPLGLSYPATGYSTLTFSSTSSVYSPNIINIIGPTEIHIRCNNFAVNIYESRVQNPSSILAIIPIVGNQLDSQVYIPAYPKMFGEAGVRMDTLTFQITDEFGNILNLNGFGVKIQLALYLTNY